MRGYNHWNHLPYLPAIEAGRGHAPFICRLAPYEDRCQVQWLGQGDTFHLCYRIRGRHNWINLTVPGCQAWIDGLNPETEYEIKVLDPVGAQSPIRLIRTSYVEGTVVNYLHPDDGQYAFSGKYLCSPSLVRLPSGSLLASMDVYGPSMSQNLTLLFRSTDEGVSWDYVTDIFPCFWGKLFCHKDKLYLLGVSNEYGDILIGCSTDEGSSWSTPEVILRGSSDTKEYGNHRAPMVILQSHGRLWTGTEFGAWKKHKFYDSLLSIDQDADLMKAENWRLTEFICADPSWPGYDPEAAGAIEGNAVEGPGGEILDFLRYGENKALILKADPDDPEKRMEFVRFASFPLGHTKFEILRRQDGVWLALGNPCPGRNVLSLYTSDDLETWEKQRDVISHPECSVKEVGFQYPVFLAEGNELLILSRTAWNHAHNYHDSNYITFHRLTLEH